MALSDGDTLDIYMATGKRKHPRVFWIEMSDRSVCWGKKRQASKFKREKLMSIEAAPRIQTARELFDAIDTDGSGELDEQELQLLYRRARGEKLGKKDLAAAMATMDTDGDGTISFTEFERWWSANGGDLEVHRDRALTIGAGELHLLLVAPDVATKARWIAGCRELLGIAEPPLSEASAPAPEPALEPEPTPEREPESGLTASAQHVRMDGRHVPELPVLAVPGKSARDALFNSLDVNGNGGLSLAEIDKGVVSGIFTDVLSPQGSTSGEGFNHKPALMRAYHAADRSKDGFIERSEFTLLLQYMVYFNNLWHKFEAIDSDHDRRLDLVEFTTGCNILGLQISAEEAEEEFMRCDADGGGMILFGEFCAWCAARHVSSMALSREEVQRDVVSTAMGPRSHSGARAEPDVASTVDAIRGALTTRWKTLSGGPRRQDKLRKLFSFLDEDNSGSLGLDEFCAAIRKAGQIPTQVVTDDEIQALFECIDVDHTGVVTLDGLCACIWGGSEDEDVSSAGGDAPEPEPEPQAAPHVQIPDRENLSSGSTKNKRKKKKSSEHFPWQDTKLAERTDAKRPWSAKQQQQQPKSTTAGSGPRLPSKMRPISASTAYSSPRATEAADLANERRRARMNRVAKHLPRETVYHREKEPHDYWSQLKAQRNRLATERGYATSEASFATTDRSVVSTSAWHSMDGTTDKWLLGLSSLNPDDLPAKDDFDNAARSPARPSPSSGFGQKTTPKKAPRVRDSTPAEAEPEVGDLMAIREASIRSSSPTSNADGLGLRRLSSAAGMGSPRERELTRQLNNHALTSHERNEIRRQRVSVREKLVTTWKSLSYTKNGQDPAKLFSIFDKDKNGVLDELEFRQAVRKGGQITASMMSDKSVLRLFHAIDTDGSGTVTAEELTSFLWAADGMVALDTPTASPSSSRAASPDGFTPPMVYKSAMQQQCSGDDDSVGGTDDSLHHIAVDS